MRLQLSTKSFLATVAFALSVAANPTLTPGAWINITPTGLAGGAFAQGMALDPSNPSTIYFCTCNYDSPSGAMYKSTNAGSTWAKISPMDQPIHVGVDPKNSNHLYAVDGVRGATAGFWVSTDGGATWTIPQGFVTLADGPLIGTRDCYSFAADPTDFNHVLVTFHSPWKSTDMNCGVVESKDGGNTWAVINAPSDARGGYGMSVFFLYAPWRNQGNDKTWLFTPQTAGYFKTTDGGTTWNQVYTWGMVHGGNQVYCAKNGTLYSGGYQYPVRSTDNGSSWQQVTDGIANSYYVGIYGDGTTIYTGQAYSSTPYYSSPEATGLKWSSSAQTFPCGPFEMAYDTVSHIMYSSNGGGNLGANLWALKTTALSTSVAVSKVATARANGAKSSIGFVRSAISIRSSEGGSYDVKGRIASER